MKIYALSTAPGCATNLMETAAWREHFELSGGESCSRPEEADLVLVNTCAYSKEAEDASMRKVTELRKSCGRGKVKVTGCLKGIAPGRLSEVFDGELLEPPIPALDFFASHHSFDPRDFQELLFKHKVVLSSRRLLRSVEHLLGGELQPLHNVLETVMVNERFHLVTVSRGCMGSCTFCAIRKEKGKVKSRPLDAILAELDGAISRGERRFWLLGDDLGCWGLDVGSRLPELLAAILKRSEDISLVLNYVDPAFALKYASELLDLLSDPRVLLVNVPIQSGSPRVLRRMGRSTDIDSLLQWVRKVKARNPALVVKTNVLVGFPAESMGDLLRTWRALWRFDAVVALPYSLRPGTPAAKLPGQHAEISKKVRAWLTASVGSARHSRVLAGSLLRGPRTPRSGATVEVDPQNT